jgi:hypothetical protein
MKIVLKLKEHKEKKKLMKDINRSFEELGDGIVKIDRIETLKEIPSIIDVNLKIPEISGFLLKKSGDIDYSYDDTIEYVRYPGRRRKIFKNLTNELEILKKNKIQLNDVNTNQIQNEV